MKKCGNCGKTVNSGYFCGECGAFLREKTEYPSEQVEKAEYKVKRIIDNLSNTPHQEIAWDEVTDMYAAKVERLRALLSIKDIDVSNETIFDKMDDFLDQCRRPEYQIAFVGTIKTGKSTLINALLGKNYASTNITPETAALTKFRSSDRDYIKITFYSKKEWEEFWNSITDNADVFSDKYKELNADAVKEKWVGHKVLFKEIANGDIEAELKKWSTAQSAEHFFVKEIEVGISTIPKEFPKQVVFVDTPGLQDPVAYRSNITKEYIRRANAVFVCITAKSLADSELKTLQSVFSLHSHNKKAVYVIATHWDELNYPIEEQWNKQFDHFVETLDGSPFFGDRKTAKENIMCSSAYLFNLCRDYRENRADDHKRQIMSFMLKAGLDFSDVDGQLDKMQEMFNIGSILNVMNDELVANYAELLKGDIASKYTDILYDLKRFATEQKKSKEEFIKVTEKGLEEIQKKLDEEKKRADTIKESQKMLTEALAAVEKRTRSRLDRIFSDLEKSKSAEVK